MGRSPRVFATHDNHQFSHQLKYNLKFEQWIAIKNIFGNNDMKNTPEMNITKIIETKKMEIKYKNYKKKKIHNHNQWNEKKINADQNFVSFVISLFAQQAHNVLSSQPHRRRHNFVCRHQLVAESMNHRNVHIVVAHSHAIIHWNDISKINTKHRT